MTPGNWVTKPVGDAEMRRTREEAVRRRLRSALGVRLTAQVGEADFRFVIGALELRVVRVLEDGSREELQRAAAEAFQAARVLPRAQSPMRSAKELVELGCLGVLGDRGPDVRRVLRETELPALSRHGTDWGSRVWATILEVWLRLLRQDGWSDLDAVVDRVGRLREQQKEFEPEFLQQAERDQDTTPAWLLMTDYHLAKAAEILGTYQAQGSVEGRFDIREQLEAQFDRAIAAAGKGGLLERELFARLLAPTARTIVGNSIWTVTRGVNSRVSRFVRKLVSRDQHRPIFEMLPPQRRALREQGLLGSGRRSIVVSLPTSNGKTYIAIFRILQALNQFDQERGWIAYLAPTRALVNQLTLRLRRELGRIGDVVEKVSPALEVDGLEAAMLGEEDDQRQFRILVTTPEKLDLLVRNGWEQQIGRPLTLVVFDEAHGIGTPVRGLRLELLLATINRECGHAQFLLLTPFVPNSAEVARWLAPESNKSIELSVDWVPNDRIIALAEPTKLKGRGNFDVRLTTCHTTRKTLHVPDILELGDERPLGLSWSQVSKSPGKLAAATAASLQKRGTVIVLVDKPQNSWSVAEALKTSDSCTSVLSTDLEPILEFLREEMGQDYPLTSLLEHGIGVHHAGLSDDARTLVEWLAENSDLKALVATTTIAHGVNFPVSGVVLASYQNPYGQDMPAVDFWNIAGRAGRVDQGDLGIVALAANNTDRAKKIERFIQRSVGALNSTLIDLVQEVAGLGHQEGLESIAWKPGWSAFLQYLAHTYRQIGDHDQFALQVEQVLRGTLGFRALRAHSAWGADRLVELVHQYADRIRGKPLRLVDATGFSWESVHGTLARLTESGLRRVEWSPELFDSRRSDLQRMMGVLLQVPELREQLEKVIGSHVSSGDTLAAIICDWVHGRSLSGIASKYFADRSADTGNRVKAMTKCCQSVFGRLTQSAAWGLAALQVLTGETGSDDHSSAAQPTALANLPARVYYGVNSDEAVALRLLGVPRLAAEPLARELRVSADRPLHTLRSRLDTVGVEPWTASLGSKGAAYHRVWSIIEGRS